VDLVGKEWYIYTYKHKHSQSQGQTTVVIIVPFNLRKEEENYYTIPAKKKNAVFILKCVFFLVFLWQKKR
jgi:UDP-galactopyranose mutase